MSETEPDVAGLREALRGVRDELAEMSDGELTALERHLAKGLAQVKSELAERRAARPPSWSAAAGGVG